MKTPKRKGELFNAAIDGFGRTMARCANSRSPSINDLADVLPHLAASLDN